MDGGLLVMEFKEHSLPLSLGVQWNKNRSIWLRNEKNSEKCSIIDTCSVMGSFTLTD